MTYPRSWSVRCLLVAAMVVASIAAQSTQAGVRLIRVPDRVALPASPGENLIVEVEVLGLPDSVWLAMTAADLDRVPLESAGSNHFQINLRDDRVLSLLGADRDAGDLRVFARKDGMTRQSAKIAWVRSQPGKVVTCTIVGVDGKQRQSEAGSEPWLDPAKVERIEVRGLAMPQAKVVAVADGTTLPLTRSAVHRPFVLAMNDGVRKSIYQAADLGVDVQHGGKSWWFGFRIVPGQLEPEDPSFVVMQRRRVTLPGSNDWLRVHVGDITAGQALVSVTDALGRFVAHAQSLGEKDFLDIELANEQYVLVVDRLVNRLVGNDHASFRIVEKKRFKPDEIAMFIRRIVDAKVLFVREGQDYNADLAQRFLRARYLNHRGPKWTLEQFVEAASKSSRNGEPYQVRLPDGTVVAAKEWFTAQLKKMRSEQR